MIIQLIGSYVMAQKILFARERWQLPNPFAALESEFKFLLVAPGLGPMGWISCRPWPNLTNNNGGPKAHLDCSGGCILCQHFFT